MFRHMPATCKCDACRAIRNTTTAAWKQYQIDVTADAQAMTDTIADLDAKLKAIQANPTKPQPQQSPITRALKRHMNAPMDTRPVIGVRTLP